MTTSYCSECGSTDELDLGRKHESLCCGAPVKGGHFRPADNIGAPRHAPNYIKDDNDRAGLTS